jgi:hypothetical protein
MTGVHDYARRLPVFRAMDEAAASEFAPYPDDTGNRDRRHDP